MEIKVLAVLKGAVVLKRWNDLKLVSKFAVAGSVVMLIGMTILGLWISERIQESVTENTAAATALYMDSFVAPLVQELAKGKKLTRRHRRELDRLLIKTSLGKRVVSMKIWKENGYIAYSPRPSIIGKTFAPTENLKRAWTGVVTAEYDSLVDEEDALERAAGKPFLEIYAPIRARGQGAEKIIAVAEFYEQSDGLEADLRAARMEAWFLIGLVWFATFTILFVIVRQGSQTIDSQRRSLEDRIEELSDLLEQNDQLRIRVEHAYRQAGDINEHFLKNIGADLHDGPAQLLSLAILRLENLKSAGKCEAKANTATGKNFEIVQSALSDALAEIRNISSDLVTPDVDHMSLSKLLESAVETHKKRTGTEVDAEILVNASNISRSAKINIYRFAQESLNNAFQHADGKKQKLVAQTRNGTLTVQVSDKGPGFNYSNTAPKGEGLGLAGMRNRIQSLMGTFDIKSGPDIGTCVTAKLELAKLDKGDVRKD
ncbi:MAG: sensor histidine kinase [Methyloligellaceae bacterium]